MTCALALFVVAVAGAQDARAVDDLRAYRTLVDAYRAGGTAPVHELLTWSQQRVRGALAQFGASGDPDGPLTSLRANAAAMLHTDAALHVLGYDEPVAADFHLDVASQLLHRSGEPSRTFAAAWYHTVSNALKLRAEPGLLEALLRRARDRLRDDPAVLFESGVLLEWQAGFPVDVPASDVGRPLVADRFFRRLTSGRVASLLPAHSWLRRVIELQPANDLARLHLGRVQMILRDRGAPDTLDDIITRNTREPALLYLAHLFTGAAAERSARFDDAARHYEAATAVLPDGQTARIALASVLQRAGRFAESATAMAAMLDSPPDANDPWFRYLVDAADAVDARLIGLRTLVRR